ncbi:MAG: manganese efflux pump [Turicibacter sp.]|nr:manganese efflux pump [Turicibacter sp.]
MILPILSGLIVSVDAFFIGLSLGLQERCKFIHLVTINAFLFGLCMLGFFIAESIYELIPFDADLVVGFAFIALGSWYIINHFVSQRLKKQADKQESRTIVFAGLIMSVEAMLITMGITFVFLPESTILIPATVALAHFGYSVISFYLVRTKYMKQLPDAASHVISGLGLIVYGLLALFVDFGM